MDRPSRNLRQAMVFDMDGTLFDSTECVTTAFRETVVAAGGPDYSAADVVAAYRLGPPGVILEHLLGRPVTNDDEKAYLALLRVHQDLILVYDGIREVLAAMVSASVPIALFTGASRGRDTASRRSPASASFLRRRWRRGCPPKT